MNIEVLEFYPFDENKNNDFIRGTLKIRLPEQGMVIMGIFASRSKGRYFFKLPSRTGADHKTGEKVEYRIVIFEDKEKNKALIEAIREKGQLFIEARLADIEWPLVFPSKASACATPSKLAEQGKGLDVQQKREETKLMQPQGAKLATLVSKIEAMEFQDPPPRKAAFTKSSIRSSIGWK